MALSFIKQVVSLSEVDKDNGVDIYGALMAYDEEVIYSYKSVRDRAIFTNKRVIIIDTQGITGKKKEFLSIFYSKISAFSIETAGSFDLDCDLKLFVSPMGEVELGFIRGTDIYKISQLMSTHIK
ncbi:MAG: PH domain-containing protein [Bacteroidales bacterium]